MFRLFTYKNPAVLSVFMCIILLAYSGFNCAAVITQAGVTGGVKVPIVMYHHICNNESRWGDYIIPGSLLEEDFLYFKENGITPVAFKDLKEFIQTGKQLPKKCIVITFDDGQKSFITKALPLLEKYNYPANINIVGSLVKLYTENGDTNDNYAYLNRQDIEFLSEHPLIELGCHTYNFHSLNHRRGIGRLNGEGEEDYKKALGEDILLFNELFSDITGKTPEIYAYPYGIRNDTALEFLKGKGYFVTLTCREGVNTLNKGDTLYELGRFNRPYGKSSEEFFGKMYE